MSRKNLGIALLVIGVILLLVGLFALPAGGGKTALIVIGIIAIIVGLILLFTGEEAAVEGTSTAPAAASAAKEELTKIEGVGPKVQEILYAAGVTSFSGLAGKSADQLTEMIKAGGFKAPFDPSSWAQQAGLAAKGDWDALQELQDKLSGGRA